jgi:hypothetical protein
MKFYLVPSYIDLSLKMLKQLKIKAERVHSDRVLGSPHWHKLAEASFQAGLIPHTYFTFSIRNEWKRVLLLTAIQETKCFALTDGHYNLLSYKKFKA